MSSAAIPGHVGLHQAGTIYNCQINGHTVLADSEAELFDAIGQVIDPEYLAPFRGNGFTWTFVRNDTAREYDYARKHPECRANASNKATHALNGAFTMSGTYMVYPSLAAYEAVDWIDANCKHRVIAWSLPCTEEHFYLFEDAKEAMLFKLQGGSAL
ncbi:hypothetical protein [Ensifer sp. SL37]|uniref:hypothetical protein n=1 Tax=Ensifer sp. SL37 TaxID=2995137 RepID=UPI00227296D0|nr:hypothetical protein [Ensifer sp. SL37]MCY1741446.1 hypothetical protein [Ensifer sp. SL37]